ncbi:hypothetical protein [Vibrio comitans]|uniref:Uncharacterized protein n=1 Tax=Vibrio comitans NBRC 102076 TaxID=1219078 RepID=A0A4Y3IP67_9VIBR|nr:hypothetical protein [Vibrio comitans]GEA61047.1 hypothetical protein VCO01S_22400 [Vibrio comitans NBRC 102076]
MKKLVIVLALGVTFGASAASYSDYSDVDTWVYDEQYPTLETSLLKTCVALGEAKQSNQHDEVGKIIELVESNGDDVETCNEVAMNVMSDIDYDLFSE